MAARASTQATDAILRGIFKFEFELEPDLSFTP